MDGFRSTTYNGGDSLYKGKTSEFDYLRNRMGYRFVVRDVRMTTELSADDNFELETNIENVGFGATFPETNRPLLSSRAMVSRKSSVCGISMLTRLKRLQTTLHKIGRAVLHLPTESQISCQPNLIRLTICPREIIKCISR